MNKISESILSVRMDNDEIVFEVEEPFYLIELLEDCNMNYTHKHYCDGEVSSWNDKVYINGDYYEKVMNHIDIEKKYVRVCNRCGYEVVFDDDLVSYESDNEYGCACLNHDEDLWFFETSLVPKRDVVKFISEEDKEYFRKHYCLPVE